ncbi:hypothetical protein ACRTEC_04795 [Janibacter indicus]
MIPPQPQQHLKAQPGTKRTTLAIVALVLGVGSCVLGCCTAASPIALFVLAGGGDTDGFEEFARGPELVGAVLVGLSAPLLVAGAILFALRDR